MTMSLSLRGICKLSFGKIKCQNREQKKKNCQEARHESYFSYQSHLGPCTYGFPQMLSSTLQLSHHKTTVTDCFIYSLIIGRHPPSDLAAAYRSGFLRGSQFSSIMQKNKSKINKVVTQTCRVSQMFWKKLRGRGSIQPRKCSKKFLFFSNVYPPPCDVHLIFPLHHLFFKIIPNFPKPSQLSISMHSIWQSQIVIWKQNKGFSLFSALRFLHAASAGELEIGSNALIQSGIRMSKC